MVASFNWSANAVRCFWALTREESRKNYPSGLCESMISARIQECRIKPQANTGTVSTT